MCEFFWQNTDILITGHKFLCRLFVQNHTIQLFLFKRLNRIGGLIETLYFGRTVLFIIGGIDIAGRAKLYTDGFIFEVILLVGILCGWLRRFLRSRLLIQDNRLHRGRISRGKADRFFALVIDRQTCRHGSHTHIEHIRCGRQRIGGILQRHILNIQFIAQLITDSLHHVNIQSDHTAALAVTIRFLIRIDNSQCQTVSTFLLLLLIRVSALFTVRADIVFNDTLQRTVIRKLFQGLVKGFLPFLIVLLYGKGIFFRRKRLFVNRKSLLASHQRLCRRFVRQKTVNLLLCQRLNGITKSIVTLDR